jgi:hypothetical protein
MLFKLIPVSYLLSNCCLRVWAVSNVHYCLCDDCGSSTNTTLNPCNITYKVQIKHMVHLCPPPFLIDDKMHLRILPIQY